MADLSSFDGEYDGDLSTVTTGFGDDTKKLPDGDYDIEITAVNLRNNKGHNILELHFVVVDVLETEPSEESAKARGAKLKHAYFMDELDQFKRVLKYMQNLGFDTPNWIRSKERSASVEFRKAYRWLKNMRVKARKDHYDKEKDGKEITYHILHLNARITTTNSPDGTLYVDGLPAVIGPEQIEQPDPTDPFAAVLSA